MLRNSIRSNAWLAIPRENRAYECDRTSLPLMKMRKQSLGHIGGSKQVGVKLLHQLFLTENNSRPCQISYVNLYSTTALQIPPTTKQAKRLARQKQK
jgi:hypothetical protein